VAFALANPSPILLYNPACWVVYHALNYAVTLTAFLFLLLADDLKTIVSVTATRTQLCPGRARDDANPPKFKNPINLDPIEVEPEHLINVVKGCGANHDKTGEKNATDQGKEHWAGCVRDEQAQANQARGASDSDRSNESGLERAAAVVPTLFDREMFAEKREPGLQVQLLVNS
jgi:hypothetical protein